MEVESIAPSGVSFSKEGEDEYNQSSRLKGFLTSMIVLLVLSSLVIYWFFPITTTEFLTASNNYNFSTSNQEIENIQFYPNMRYSDSQISYNIHDCPLKREYDMKEAFEIISNLTILEFSSVNFDEEISVTCEDQNKIEGGLFIAGEGGPVNISKIQNFNVISKGKILLLKNSRCKRPNVALHELLHTLGFDHSSNPNNIMYNISKCKQTIGEDTINFLNNIYSIPSFPDLGFENVSAIMRGKYLDVNISIRNNGFKKAQETKILIYADEKLVKEIEIEQMELGYGRIISLENVWISKRSVKELKFLINSSFEELDKENNVVTLHIKK